MSMSFLSVAFIMLLAAILLIASIAATVLGWVAVAQIRRSAGKLYGMWLAVFDGLLFPLLAVDALLMMPFGLVARFYQNGTVHAVRYPEFVAIPLWLGLACLSVITLTDIFIVRAVWRAVNAPSANSGPAQTAGRTDAPRQSSAGKWIAGGCAVLAVIGAALVLFSLAGFFWLRMSNVTHARAIREKEMGRQQVEMAGLRQVRFKFSHPDQLIGGHTITLRAKAGTDTKWAPDTGQNFSLKGGKNLEFRVRVDASTPGSTVAWVSTKLNEKWDENRAELGAANTSASLDFANGLHVSITLLEDESYHPGISPLPAR